MSSAVQYSPFKSMTYNVLGKTLSKKLFHILHDSLPEKGPLSTIVLPRVMVAMTFYPDSWRKGNE